MSDNLIAGNKVLLVGAGPMAQDYAKILQQQQVAFEVIGRGDASAEKFAAATGKNVFVGGLDSFIAHNTLSPFDKAIVATGMEALKGTAIKLMQHGIKVLLIEKPGAISLHEIQELYEYSVRAACKVFIAYNRRFYASVEKLMALVEEDGGVLSFNFEFTEWAHKIEPLHKAEGVKENWFFGNSTHVIDLAFYLGGKPTNMVAYTAGKLDWHPVAIFSGAGVSENGALFSYQANWQAPGRWAVEILTSKRRFYLKPLEKLQVQKIGSVEVAPVVIDDTIDIEFKPGLFKQTVAFLESVPGSGLVSLEEHIGNCRYYRNILTSGILNQRGV